MDWRTVFVFSAIFLANGANGVFYPVRTILGTFNTALVPFFSADPEIEERAEILIQQVSILLMCV